MAAVTYDLFVDDLATDGQQSEKEVWQGSIVMLLHAWMSRSMIVRHLD